MLRLDKETFFNQRQLLERSFYYSYNGQNYEMSLDYIIRQIDGSHEEKCLFLLNELKATNDFIVNVYLQDLADEYMQNHISQSLCEEIECSLLEKHESYSFRLTKRDCIYEYIAYQDEEGKYHADKLEDVGKFAGYTWFNNFSDKLRILLKSHTFDCKKIEKPEASNK